MKRILISAISFHLGHGKIMAESAMNDDLSVPRSEKHEDPGRVDRIRGLFRRIFNRRRSDHSSSAANTPPEPQAQRVPLSRVEETQSRVEADLSRFEEERERARKEAESLRSSQAFEGRSFDLGPVVEDEFESFPALEQSPSVQRVTETQAPPKPAMQSSGVQADNFGSRSTLTHSVQPGESLRLIARQYYQNPGFYRQIQEWNQLQSDVLQVGQKLVLKNVKEIPDASSAPLAVEDSRNEIRSMASMPPEEIFPADAYRFKIYRVQGGDTLSGIASREMGATRHAVGLGRFNDLATNSYLYVGQTLVVPVQK